MSSFQLYSGKRPVSNPTLRRTAAAVSSEEMLLSTLNGGEKIVIDWVTERFTPTPPPNTLKVTILEGKCTLEGSLQVPAGLIGFHLFNQDPVRTAALGLITVDEGKTLADVAAWTSITTPPWAQVIEFIIAEPGKDILTTTVVQDKPIYLVCMDGYPERQIGALGPIEATR